MKSAGKGLALIALGIMAAGCTAPTTRQGPIDPALTREEIRYQQALKLHRVVEYQGRIERIAAPLLKAALPFCEGNTTSLPGLKVDNISDWPGEYRQLAKESLGLDEALKVTYVVPGLAADSAGVQVGDVVLTVNGKYTVGGTGAVADYRQLIQRAGDRPIKLGIVRGEQKQTLTLVPERACNYPVHVVMDNAINAFTDGHNVVITSGLIRFAESDAEVAMVIAHEIAHNGMKHIEAKQTNSSTASLLDILVAAYGVNTHGLFARLGAQSFSRDFEQEADYVGMYILARASIPMDGLSEFWRRMAAESPDANKSSIARTHPISARRTLAIQQVAVEIAEKVEREEALLPDSE